MELYAIASGTLTGLLVALLGPSISKTQKVKNNTVNFIPLWTISRISGLCTLDNYGTRVGSGTNVGGMSHNVGGMSHKGLLLRDLASTTMDIDISRSILTSLPQRSLG